MKRFYLLTLALTIAYSVAAQTLNIHRGQITVAVPADQAGDMTCIDGTTLNIAGADYNISDIQSITITDTPVESATVSVTYNGATAHVLTSSDIAPYLTITVTGADVSIIAAPTFLEEITYKLSGTSTNGSFFMEGEFKATVILNNLTLTNQRGAAIDIANGKRINIVLPAGTTTTLVDGSGGTHDACFFVNGHPEFSGQGKLVLTGNTKHAFASDEYTMLPADFGTIEVLGAMNDGLHIEQYFDMRGGTVIVKNVGGDCIDIKKTKDATDVQNGQGLISGGSITMDVATDDTKGLRTEDILKISGGTITATVSGNGCKGIGADADLFINQDSGNATLVKMTVTGTTYMPGDVTLESKCRGIKGKGNFTFNGGNIDIIATGAKSKAISIDGNYIYQSGTLNCAVDAANT